MIPAAHVWRAVALVLLVALVVLTTCLGLTHARQSEAARLLGDSQQRQRLLVELSDSLAQAEAAQRGFLLDHAPTEIQSYQSARARVQPTFEHYAQLLSTPSGAAIFAEQHNTLSQLRGLIPARLAEFDSELHLPALGASGGSRAARAAAVRSGPSQSTATQITQDAALLGNAERRLSDAQDSRIARLQAIAQGLTAGLLLLTLALLAGAALRARRQQFAPDSHTDADGAARSAPPNELAALSRHLQHVTERDKAQLARSLHDELGGLLIAVKMDSSWLHKRWPDPNPDVQARWERVFKGLDDGVDFKRRVVENLRPTLLDNVGLLAALRWITQETCGRAGLAYTEGYPEEEPLLAEDVSILVFRLVQEALTNIVKHAHATDVRVEIENVEQQLTVLIEDNGVGIDRRPPSATALHGLTIMGLRVSSLGGTFAVEPGANRGTRVRAQLPSQGTVARTCASARRASAV